MLTQNVPVAVSDGAVAKQINAHFVASGELRVGAEADIGNLARNVSNGYFGWRADADKSRISGDIVAFAADVLVFWPNKLI